MLKTNFQVSNFTIRLVANNASASGLFCQGTIDLQEFLQLYCVVLNTTNGAANNVRTLIQGMRVKRLQFWCPPTLQTFAAGAQTGLATPSYLWCRLGATNNANATPFSMPSEYYSSVSVGLTEPAYLSINVPKTAVLGNWFGGASTFGASSGLNGALQYNVADGTVFDITFDAMLAFSDDFGGDTIETAQYRTRTYTGSVYVGQIIVLVPGSATGIWTAAPPMDWS